MYSTLPGRLVKVHVHSLTHVKSVEFKKGEDRAVSVVVWGGQVCVCVCMCVCVYSVHMCVRVRVRVRVHVCFRVRVHVRVLTAYMSMCVCLLILDDICAPCGVCIVCVGVRVYVCVCVCVYTRTHEWELNGRRILCLLFKSILSTTTRLICMRDITHSYVRLD